MEVLFESRRNISDFSGELHFVQWKPEIHPEPVLLPDTFADRLGVSSYGAVLRDNGLLRMWYQATPGDWDFIEDVSAVAYAESRDGYEWKKPHLELVNYGSRANNFCDLGLHAPSIFIDPHAPREMRYRATGCGRPGAGSRGFRYGYYTAHSSDGLRWDYDSDQPQWEGGDVITSVYHPGRNEGVIALKNEVRVSRLLRRSIQTARYRDGIFSERIGALQPDEYDDCAAMQRGYASGDYYGMAMLPAGKSLVGFLWNFRHNLPYSNSEQGNRGPCDISLIFQEKEEDRWLHMPGRPDFISHQDLPWTSHGWIHSSAGPVEVNGEHRLYFSGCNFTHGLGLCNGKPDARWVQWRRKNGVSGITFARWPKFRLFGFETPSEAVFKIRLTSIGDHQELRLNYRARTGGRVRVALEGSANQTLEDCVNLEGDDKYACVSWKNGPRISSHPAENLTLIVHLEMAAVYAYELVPA